MALPSTSGPALLLTAGPMLLAHRLTGYVSSAFRYPFEGDVPPQFEASARVTFIDAAVERYLATISQFVILGAGFDTRAFRLPRPGQIRCFEVDMPQTQASKRQLLAKAGIDSTIVTFVAADFETEDWLARLVEAGFDPNQPAVFPWEGVIMYLDRQAVESTLRKIATTAKGSVLVFDYFTIEPLRSRTVYCVSAEPRPKPLANRSASGSTAHRHRAIDSPSCSRPVGWAWPRSARSARRRTAGGPGPALRSQRWPPSRSHRHGRRHSPDACRALRAAEAQATVRLCDTICDAKSNADRFGLCSRLGALALRPARAGNDSGRCRRLPASRSSCSAR